MIQEHLSQMASITSGNQKEYYSWLLENGRLFTEQIDSEEIPDYVTMKKCYGNAIQYSCHKKIEYVEGFYLTEFGIPFEHAFNLKDGKVIDVTTQKFGFGVSEWFGIVLDMSIVLEYIQSDCPEWMMPLQYYYLTKIKKTKSWK